MGTGFVIDDPVSAIIIDADPIDNDRLNLASHIATQGQFSSAVALQGDWAFLGRGGFLASRGLVQVFRRDAGDTPDDLSDDVWILASELQPAGSGDYFGNSVALDGDWLVVGDPYSGIGGGGKEYDEPTAMRSPLIATGPKRKSECRLS